MRDYEVVYIFDSELGDEEVESKLDSYHEKISDGGSGEITAVEDWGKRQLAYPIEDRENGRYVVAQFTVEPSALDEFERSLELDGDLLRHLVVLHEGELPTPPSARRPGAGPGDEDEGEEQTEEEPDSAEDGDEDEKEEADDGEEDSAESDEPESGEEAGDDETDADDDGDEDDESGGDGEPAPSVEEPDEEGEGEADDVEDGEGADEEKEADGDEESGEDEEKE